MELKTTTVWGYLRFWGLAKLKRFRPKSWRFAEEQIAIEAWLARVVAAAKLSGDLALEVAECARLIKGYGDTWKRGSANYATIEARVIAPVLEGRIPVRAGIDAIASARTAALLDPEGERPAPRRSRRSTRRSRLPLAAEYGECYFLSATCFNCASPFSKSGPSICSMLMNRQIALPMKFCVPRHGPDHVGLTAGFGEHEIRIARAFERLDEIGARRDALVRLALRDGHRAGADLVVAVPAERGARARLRARERHLGVRVELRPGRPVLPFLQVVHLREHGRGGRRDHGRRVRR